MKYRIITIVAAVFLIAVSGLASADILPKPVPENQLFTMDSIIEAVGPVQEKTTVAWNIGDAGLNRLANPRYTADGNIESGSIAYVTYSDAIVTNGGQIAEVKSFRMDTNGKTEGLYNIETSKVLTYTSQNGSHLMGEESYVLDVAGNWRQGLDNIVCVFSRNTDKIIPAFCNKVTASSKLTQITTAQVETIGALTAVSNDQSTPAALKYEISVAPDSNSASGYADGIVSTTFTVSVMEGRRDGTVIPGTDAIPATPGQWVGGTFDQCTPGATLANCRTLADFLGVNTGLAVEFVRANPNAAVKSTIAAPQDKDRVFIYDSQGNSASWVYDAATTWINPTSGWGAQFMSAAEIGTTYANLPAFLTDVVYDGTGALNLGFPLTPDYRVVDMTDLWLTVGGQWVPGTDGTPATGPQLTGFDQLTAKLTYIDTATVSGGISTFNKVFDYKSGVACTDC